MTWQFFNSLKDRPLCKTVTSCSGTANWVYPLTKNPRDNRVYDKLDFRPNIILDKIRNVLGDPKMKGRHSTLLINLGIHYALSMNFTTYQKLIDDVLVILRNRRELGSAANIVWKTTTAIRKEKEMQRGNMMIWRFITEQVRS